MSRAADEQILTALNLMELAVFFILLPVLLLGIAGYVLLVVTGILDD